MRRLLLVLSASLLLYGCGGGGSNPPSSQPISVSLSPSTQTTLDQGQTVAYTATVSNDSRQQGSYLVGYRDRMHRLGVRRFQKRNGDLGHVQHSGHGHVQHHCLGGSDFCCRHDQIGYGCGGR